MSEKKKREFNISDGVVRRVSDEELAEELGSVVFKDDGLKGVTSNIILDSKRESAEKFTDEYNNTTSERLRLKGKKMLPRSNKMMKKHHGWLFYATGITDPVVISEAVGVSQDTVLTWLPDFLEQMENKLTQNSLAYTRSIVTSEDIAIHKATRASVSNMIVELNDEIANSARIDSKISAFLDKLDDAIDNDISDRDAKKILALINYYADRDKIRKTKLDTLAKLKSMHEDDSGITMQKKLEEEKESAVRKFIINNDLKLFYEKKGHKNITKKEIVDTIKESENTIIEFADFSSDDKSID